MYKEFYIQRLLRENLLIEDYRSQIKDLENQLMNVRNKHQFDDIQNKIARLKKLVSMGVNLNTNTLNGWMSGSVLVKDGQPIPLYHASNNNDLQLKGEAYLTTDINYSKNFGNVVYEYISNIANPIDLTDLGVEPISASELLDHLGEKGLDISNMNFLRGSKTHSLGSNDAKQPFWAWIKVNHQDITTNKMFRNIIETKHDGIKYLENYTGSGATALCYLIFDERNIQRVNK